MLLNRYTTERPYLSTQIFALEISRAKARQLSAYIKFSLALNEISQLITKQNIFMKFYQILRRRYQKNTKVNYLR